MGLLLSGPVRKSPESGYYFHNRDRVATGIHWLNLSAQVYRKLKQLKRERPFDLVQFPNYSLCGLISIPAVAYSARTASVFL